MDCSVEMRSEEFQIINFGELNLLFAQNNITAFQGAINQIKSEDIPKEKLLEVLKQISNYAEDFHLSENTEITEILSKIESADKPYVLYQIIGDNLDLIINVRQKSTQNLNKSFHWFHLYAIKDTVSGIHLPNKHNRKLKDVPVREFLPDMSEISHRF